MSQTPNLKALSLEELNALIERYPWFSAARAVRRERSQNSDSQLDALSADRLFFGGQPIDGEAILHLNSEDLIDRFLKEKELRIVAEEGEPETEIITEAELSEEEDLVSEDLAEVYLQQGLKQEALAIYRRLSLLNPEKSVYFAEIIQRLETNN